MECTHKFKKGQKVFLNPNMDWSIIHLEPTTGWIDFTEPCKILYEYGFLYVIRSNKGSSEHIVPEKFILDNIEITGNFY